MWMKMEKRSLRDEATRSSSADEIQYPGEIKSPRTKRPRFCLTSVLLGEKHACQIRLLLIFKLYPTIILRLNLEIKEFTGTIYESNLALEYIPWKHLGFGLAFNVFNLDIEADVEDYPGIDFKGEIEFRYLGLLLYGKVPF